MSNSTSTVVGGNASGASAVTDTVTTVARPALEVSPITGEASGNSSLDEGVETAWSKVASMKPSKPATGGAKEGEPTRDEIIKERRMKFCAESRADGYEVLHMSTWPSQKDKEKTQPGYTPKSNTKRADGQLSAVLNHFDAVDTAKVRTEVIEAEDKKTGTPCRVVHRFIAIPEARFNPIELSALRAGNLVIVTVTHGKYEAKIRVSRHGGKVFVRRKIDAKIVSTKTSNEERDIDIPLPEDGEKVPVGHGRVWNHLGQKWCKHCLKGSTGVCPRMKAYWEGKVPTPCDFNHGCVANLGATRVKLAEFLIKDQAARKAFLVRKEERSKAKGIRAEASASAAVDGFELPKHAGGGSKAEPVTVPKAKVSANPFHLLSNEESEDKSVATDVDTTEPTKAQRKKHRRREAKSRDSSPSPTAVEPEPKDEAGPAFEPAQPESESTNSRPSPRTKGGKRKFKGTLLAPSWFTDNGFPSLDGSQ